MYSDDAQAGPNPTQTMNTYKGHAKTDHDHADIAM